MNFEKTIEWKNNSIYFLDQTLLPAQEKILKITDYNVLAEAIKRLSIRGAPAIGVSAAFGIALAAVHSNEKQNKNIFLDEINNVYNILKSTRPTAVNLFWALNKMMNVVEKNKEKTIPELIEIMVQTAVSIQNEDLDIGISLGEQGSKIINDNDVILTHCNAGGLATAGMGSALSTIFTAHNQGKKIEVYADETRPLLQGARLTTYELKNWGIKVTLICDNMAGLVLKQGKINIVITGADRIAANGDSANKIGTYSLAVLANYHNVPFYIAAPYSTFDLELKTGDKIPIEERAADELIYFNNKQIAPLDISVYNPAFDVVPNQLIKGIITERGILKPPFEKSIRDFL